jgi:hypothetical protein
MIRDNGGTMIKEHLLLRMPNRESVAVFGDSYKVQYFDWHDGDVLLALKYPFKDSEIAAALEVGAEIVTGYSFEYYYPVSLRKVGVRGWCASAAHGIGFALSREVAEVVSAASYAEFMRDIQLCYEEQERKRRIYEERERIRRGR